MVKNEVCKSQSPVTTVDVRNKKIQSATDGSVTQYIDLSTSVRLGTIDGAAHFIPEVDNTVNHFLKK